MNAIKKSILDIKYRIPKEILQLVFSEKIINYRQTSATIDEQIENLVIRNRVMVDCDLNSGAEVLVPLDGVPHELVNNYTSIYFIPKSLTQNRSINSVLSVGYVTGAAAAAMFGMGSYKDCSVTPSLQAAQAMMNSHMPIPVISTAKVDLIAENTVMIRDVAPPVGFGFVRCILQNDENMSHLQLRAIPAFVELCVLACKAYIYNEYIITLDRGQIYAGQDLGTIKSIIDGYSEANELYVAMLREKWQKVSMMNDQESMHRFIKLHTGSMR